MSESPSFIERTYSSQDGLRLYFREYGSHIGTGCPILCLPGLTRNSHDYHVIATRLSRTHRVVCPDLRGRGRSEWDPNWRNYAPQTYINDLRHLIALLNLHRVLIIGTSMGGLLAMGMNVAMPTHVAGVVLNDVGPEIDESGLQRILDYVGHDHPAKDWKEAVNILRAIMQEVPGMTDADWLDVAEGTFRQGKDGKLHVNWDTALARAIAQSREEFNLWPLFRSLGRIPVLALRGEYSDVLGTGTFARMAAEVPSIVRVTVPGAGHTPTLSEPEARDAIDRFLSPNS